MGGEAGREAVTGAVAEAVLGDWLAPRGEGKGAEKVTPGVWHESLGTDGAVH